MAIGIIPSFKDVFHTPQLQKEEAFVLALETAARLQWQISYLSRSGMVLVSRPMQTQLVIRLQDEGLSLISESVKERFLDGGKNKEAVTQFKEALTQAQHQLSPEYLSLRAEELAAFFVTESHDLLADPARKTRSQSGDIFAIFKPVKDYFITPIILNINVLVFVLMALSGVSMVQPDSASLLSWGANFGPLTQHGEPWRLLTATFIHIGILHLVMNMYAFLLIGAQLESRLGKRRFLLAYLLTGVAASSVSLMVHDMTISAGASGAIFGMYGVFLAMLTTDLVEKRNRKQLLASILFFVVYNLLNGLQAGIDNAAHIGGLLTGLITGYMFVPALKRAQQKAVVPTQPEEIPDYY